MVQGLSHRDTGDKNPDMSAASTPIVDIHLRSLADTENAARVLASVVAPGDVIALAGDLGAGKTAFARALINALPGAPEEVPSPTFTLVQTYTRGDLDVWHFDLYRLEDPEETLELGIEDAFAEAVSLIEWPDRLGQYLPPRHLLVTLQIDNRSDARHLAMSNGALWQERLADQDWENFHV